jgi:phosphoribosylamine--glycine ligase
MKILVIGSGGREHAIVWKIAQSSLCDKVVASPGNPGMAELAECFTPAAVTAEAFLQLAQETDADLTIVGPEAPLVSGIVDTFRFHGRKIVGPTKKAAQLEGSKVFAKQFMERAGIPTARFRVAQDSEEAKKYLEEFGFPVVLKADGLAGGKGVVIVEDRKQAEAAFERLPRGRIVVEECLKGEEVSFIVLCDGTQAVPFEPTQDHKAVFDGDHGPNTGGMGAYCDDRILTPEERARIMETVVQPTLCRMQEEGDPFSGFLYAGLMMTEDGPKVLEFNVRLGDPEAQPLMYRMTSDLLATLADHAPMAWRPEPSVCVVLAAAGYPGTPRTGDLITGVETCRATVFHAGTKRTEKGLVTAGGRVLGVTSCGPNLSTAIQRTYDAVRKIHFDGVHYRTDIGKKGLKRW